MRYLGLTLILVTLLAGLAITFAEDAPKAETEQKEVAPPPPHRDGERGRDERREGGPPRGEMPSMEPLTPEQIDEAVEVMRQISPWWADRVEEARKEDEQRFVNMVTRAYPRLRQFLDLKRHDPPLYELKITEARLDSQSRRLSWELFEAQRDNQTKKAEQLKGELLGVLAEQFDATQAARQHEINTLKARLAELEKELDEHRREREQLIQERYDELLAFAERMERRRQQRDGERGPGDRPEGQGNRPDGPPPGDRQGPPRDGDPPRRPPGGAIFAPLH